MAGVLGRIGLVLREVVAPQAVETEPVPPGRTLSRTLNDGSGGGGGGAAGAAGGGGGGPPIPPLSGTFRLLVILNFILVVLLLITMIFLAFQHNASNPQVDTAYNTISNLLIASAGTFVGLIGGKAA